MFVGEKLTNLRILHGLSRQDLANALNVTEQSIWQYENEVSQPGLDIVIQLRNKFSVRNRYFYTPNFLTDDINENNIAYRSIERSSRKKTRSESVHLEFLNSIIHYVETYVKYPYNVLLEIRQYAIEYKKDNDHLDTNEIIEHLALYTREKLGLKPNNNDNLMYLIERSGAFIFEKSLTERVEAYSTWSIKTNRPYIMLGNVNKTAVRRNFDLAHELGHLILHYMVDISLLDFTEYDQIETEANLFASKFLLPTEEFKKDLECITKKSNPLSYIDLKRKWKVSLAALGRRAYELEDDEIGMDYTQYRYYSNQYYKKGFRTHEPLDSELPIVVPGKMRSLFEYLFEKHCKLENLLDFTNFEIGLFSKVFDIEESFFDKYINKTKATYFEFMPKADKF